MNSPLRNHAAIFKVLVHKEMKLFAAKMKDVFLDALMPLATQIITFGYLFPQFGMPLEKIGPVYLGSMMALFIHLGYAFLLRVAGDMNTNRLIDYQQTLPLSRPWLIGSYIISNMLETACIMIPLMGAGLIILRNHIQFTHISYISLILIFVCILFFLSSFFLAAAFSFSFNWLLDNFWPRLLIPIFLFSATLIIWQEMYRWWPLMGIIFLISPFTYMVEGLRSALLGGDQYISVWICCALLCIWSSLNIAFLHRGFIKKLDPV